MVGEIEMEKGKVWEEEKVWYGINICDLTEVPGIETVGIFLLPPREEGLIVRRGPNIDDHYIFWELPKTQQEGIDFILKKKMPRIRTQILTSQPKPYKGHLEE